MLGGDFLQLPPVKSPKLAFEAESWGRCNLACFTLTKVFRQEEAEFVRLLNELRTGRCTDLNWARLQACVGRKLPCLNGVVPTKLHAMRNDVDSENAQALSRLPLPEHKYQAAEIPVGTKYFDKCQAPEVLSLRVGAQVILVKNIDVRRGLGNGSRGIVLKFCKVSEIENDVQLMPGAEGQRWGAAMPVVQFSNALKVLLCPCLWEIREGDRFVASRSQLPLALAWALTIHKSQGQTLDRAEVFLGSSFENGMMYVAISRVRSLEGLSIGSIRRDAIKADGRAVAFYRKLAAPDVFALEAITAHVLVPLAELVHEYAFGRNIAYLRAFSS